jgi:alpha-1,2-glucosyltransferase
MAVSLAIVAIANVKRSLGIILPYITLILLFAAFIVWNGGVVLGMAALAPFHIYIESLHIFTGDKSNHIATIHLPQMLYLQPYILFFSFPLLIHSLISRQFSLPTSLGQITRAIFVLGTATNLATLAVHYNTIVHPFTLADNRHYVFYVFRVLLRREEIRYLAAPVYVGVGYVVIQSLGAKPITRTMGGKKGKTVVQPLARGCSSSFVLVWVVTTGLSLVTAPLVEPRYCILPWIMWRLHVPTSLLEQAINEKTETQGEGKKSGWNTSVIALLSETVWFLVIAAGTGYMFLYRGFSWPQEPGKTQRFMW